MADDPYTLLGVARAASEDDIKKAFRKLAKDLHPDKRPGDKAAAERFKKITAAYDLLSDPEKRKRFDRGEIDAAGEPRRTYQHARGWGGGGPQGRQRGADGGVEDEGLFSDIFSDLFRGRAGAGAGAGGFPMRGQDVRYTLEIDFLEAVAGAKKRVTLPDGGVLDLSVPEGTTDGQVLRLKGKGAAGQRGGEAGDALVEIKVRAHSRLTREGDDIVVKLPVSLDEAILGAKIEVPTVSGRVQMTLPKGTSSGTVLKLKGKGVRNARTGVVGDERVTIEIVLPEKIDEGLAYFIAEWRLKHGYNPRKGD